MGETFRRAKFSSLFKKFVTFARQTFARSGNCYLKRISSDKMQQFDWRITLTILKTESKSVLSLVSAYLHLKKSTFIFQKYFNRYQIILKFTTGYGMSPNFLTGYGMCLNFLTRYRFVPPYRGPRLVLISKTIFKIQNVKI